METLDRLPDTLWMAAKRNRKKTFIRAWRSHRGLTQAQLAERIGLSNTQLSRIENGQQEYRQDLIEIIAEELRCTPADLIMRDPTDPDAVWSIWEGLKPVERQQALAVIQALKNTTGKTGS